MFPPPLPRELVLDHVSAAILRIDGDTGMLTGHYKDGKFVISHFSGARPSEIAITQQSDGTLSVELMGQHHEGSLTGYRAEVARAKGLPEPHTGVKDPTQPLAFSFPDLNRTQTAKRARLGFMADNVLRGQRRAY